MSDTWCATAVTGIVAPPADVVAPTVPAGLTATAGTGYGTGLIILAWSASTDAGSGVAGYEISRNGVRIGTTTLLTYTDNPGPGTWSYTIDAFDKASPANISAQSTPTTPITIAPVIPKPNAPVGVAASYSAPNVTFSWTNVAGAIDYIVSRQGTRIGYAHSGTPFIDAGRPPGTWSYQVEAVGPTGLISDLSDIATVTIGAVATHRPGTDIDASGFNDNSAGVNPMQGFFNSLPQGTALSPTLVEFPANVQYLMLKSVNVKKSHLVIYGQNATFIQQKNATPSNGQLVIDSLDDITIHDLWFLQDCPLRSGGGGVGLYDGGTYGDHQHAIRCNAATNVSIYNGGGTKIRGDFIYLGTSDPPCQHILIDGFQGLVAGRQGLAITSAEDVELRNASLSMVGRTSIDIEPAGTGTSHLDGLYVHDCTFDGHWLNWISAQGVHGVDNVTIDHNTVLHGFLSMDVGIVGVVRVNWTVTNNSGSSTNTVGDTYGNGAEAVMVFRYINGLTVNTNHQSVQAGRNMYMMTDDHCTSVASSGNTGTNLVGDRHP